MFLLCEESGSPNPSHSYLQYLPVKTETIPTLDEISFGNAA